MFSLGKCLDLVPCRRWRQLGNVVTGILEQESTRLYDLMRCEATMTAKDEVAHKHFCGGRDQQRMDGYQCLDATIVPSFFLPPIFRPSQYEYFTYSQGGLKIAAKYNYLLLCLVSIIPFPNASFAIPTARKAMMPALVAIYPFTL